MSVDESMDDLVDCALAKALLKVSVELPLLDISQIGL